MSELPQSSPTCPRCGAQLAPTAAQGALCPRCLLEQGLAGSAPSHASESGAKTPPPAPPELADLAPLFPELEILELLGQGGMGAVYKARQRALGRLVALKILTPRPGHEAGFEARFEREAHALARLSHPNVVGIHDSGRTQGRCWLLMEYVEGVNLRQLLRSEDLGVPRALAIVRQVCDALEFAHAEGIVHRDIKPENVLVDKRGRVKIADFGLAKIVGDAEPGEPITRTQQSMGTPQYMAPEQLTGSPNVDHRADIYSLGVVFYELLTGDLPLGRFEPPSQRVQVDVRLDEVVLRALEREPARRYQHATELKTGIEKLDVPASAAPQARAPASDPPWMFVLFAVPIVGGVLSLAAEALAIPDAEREQWGNGAFGLALLFLCLLAWLFRGDRRGGLLRYGAGVFALSISISCLFTAPARVALAAKWFSFEPRPLDLWIARILFAVLAFEALRFAWNSRRVLRERLVERSALINADFALLCGGGLVGWQFASNPGAMLVTAVLFLCWADWGATLRQAYGPEPREWMREKLRDQERVSAPEPPQGARPRRWLRGILAPVLVALSAWVMQGYTSGWGWYGVAASSLVLALAVAGYLQQTLPTALVAELRAQSALMRSSRALAAIVVLAVGAMGLGAAVLHETPALKPPREPDMSHVVHLATLVEVRSIEGENPLGQFASRVAKSQLTTRKHEGDHAEFAPSSSPGGTEGLVLILLAPAVLIWTSRWGAGWAGCWRYSAEVLLIVLAGLFGSLPLRRVLPARAAPDDSHPLVLEASFPVGYSAVHERLETALRNEGYTAWPCDSRTYGTAEGPIFELDSLQAYHSLKKGLAGGVLEIEVAGDSGYWASAVRIWAGDVPVRERAEARERITRVLQQTRRD